MARSNRSWSCSLDVYSGRSNWLKLKKETSISKSSPNYENYSKKSERRKKQNDDTNIKMNILTMYEQKEVCQELHMPCESGTSEDRKYPAKPWNPLKEPGFINKYKSASLVVSNLQREREGGREWKKKERRIWYIKIWIKRKKKQLNKQTG